VSAVGRWLLTPRWLALHVGVLAAVAACALLGWWQLDRAQQIHDAALAPARNAALSPVAIDTLLTPGTLARDDVVGRRVTVTGTYDPGAQVLVADRSAAGVTGRAILTPLVTAGGTAVIVDRGVVASGAAPPAPPGGTVTVTGWLAASESAPSVATDLPAGELGTIHLPSLANVVTHPLYDAYVGLLEQSPAPSVALAREPGPEVTVRGDWPLQNVFYAIEWWVFGLAAVAFWVATVRRRAAEPDRPG
jgi:cytochrome oxidase assembly protein ShyY1